MIIRHPLLAARYSTAHIISQDATAQKSDKDASNNGTDRRKYKSIAYQKRSDNPNAFSGSLLAAKSGKAIEAQSL